MLYMSAKYCNKMPPVSTDCHLVYEPTTQQQGTIHLKRLQIRKFGLEKLLPQPSHFIAPSYHSSTPRMNSGARSSQHQCPLLKIPMACMDYGVYKLEQLLWKTGLLPGLLQWWPVALMSLERSHGDELLGGALCWRPPKTIPEHPHQTPPVWRTRTARVSHWGEAEREQEYKSSQFSSSAANF